MSFDFAGHYRWVLSEIRERVAALPPDGQPTVVLFGDSLSEGNPAQALAGYPVVNMGISGDEIYHPEGGLMPRLELVPAARPAHVLILIGINDLNNSGKSVETIAPHYDDLLSGLQKAVPEARLHLLSLLPTRDNYARLMGPVRSLNAILIGTAHRFGVPFVDLHPTLADSTGALRAEFTPDGLHLNPAGYEALNRFLEGYLRNEAPASR